jgi:hypothetical protein
MMASITHCSKNRQLSALAKLFFAMVCVLAVMAVGAEPARQDAPVLRVERIDDGLWLTTQLQFELPAVVHDALLKGIPIYFVASAEVLRERWYWTSRTVSSTQRRMRLVYHPLTRHWRLNVTVGEVADVVPGLALNQNFESIQDALAAVQRISRWRIADASVVTPGAKHLIAFSFQLDLTQLPRPLQIGTLGQSDWQIYQAANLSLPPEGGL